MGRDKGSSQIKWILGYVGLIALLAALVLVVFSTKLFDTEIPQLAWFLAVIVLLVTVILLLSRIMAILDVIEDSNARLERITEALEKNRALLSQIQQSVRLSEAAKAIAFGDTDRQSMREAVVDKFEQGDVAAGYQIIDEIAKRPGCERLAEQLRQEANRYQDAGEQERIKQFAGPIEQLIDQQQWGKANAGIEKLAKAYPESEQVKALRRKLMEKKEERKKVLLNAWDDAVQREATNRSIEILRELDMYLTPNEAKALQEGARDVFKNKLHNLGIQFSLAVSGQHWARAVEIGQEIMRDFPNSTMAGEIRQKIDVLRQKASQPAG
jgi:ABC-type multidrug transport system fused ATPase/permease subunit